MLVPAALLSVLAAVTAVPLDSASIDRNQCGYKNCPTYDPDVLNVHLVPHTHDDVGWLKTVDQYYFGSRNNIQKAGVQYIIDSVVKELWADPKRKFIFVETAFFWKWWVRQAKSVQNQVHILVQEGRLEFVGGAWSMNDEAAAHYQPTIDQFTWGLSKINETFGPCALPRVAWQIDPFGHSREFASLAANMGYDGLFLGRIDYQDKSTRLATKTMETLWRGDDDLGKSTDIFTGALYNRYSPPPGFCFDVLCNDEPIVDDPDSVAFNVNDRVRTFIEISRNMSRGYKTNNILITMGEDFNYQDAAMWYKNLDKLIQYTNLKAAKDGIKIKLFYSTPNCYLKAVKEANPSLPTKQDDYFPYASDPHAFWTGYFTSRPTTKYFERRSNVHLQMSKQLQVLAALEEHNQYVIDGLKSAMGVMQHHDAITGTEKQHVTSDYVRMLDRAVEDSLVVPRKALNKMMQGDGTKPPLLQLHRCLLNESACHASENSDTFIVTLYNPVAWQVRTPVRVPVRDDTYQVYAPNGDMIDSQIVDIPQQVLELPERHSTATHELVFIADLEPLVYKSFYVRKVTRNKRDVLIYKPKKQIHDLYDNINDYWKEIRDKDLEYLEKLEDVDIPQQNLPIRSTVLKSANINNLDLDILKDDKYEPVNSKIKDLEEIIKEEKGKDIKRSRQAVNAYPNLSDEEMRMLSDDPMVVERLEDYFVVENGNMNLHIDNTSGGVKAVTFTDNKTVNMSIEFYYYEGEIGNNEVAERRSSGAYIFRPKPDSPNAKPLDKLDFKVVEGNVVKEIRLNWSRNVFSIARLYNGLDYLDLEWVVGPIEVDDGIGKEFVVRYETDLFNNGEFYTDSNGRQIIKRKLNQRPQYNWTVTEEAAGNYYPVVNEIYIENDEERLVVVTDRSEGGTSLMEGNIELMLHRRLLHDDAFGVGEPLNETINGKGLIVRGNHKVLFTKKDDAYERRHVIETDLSPVIFVSETDLTFDNWSLLTNSYSWLKSPLPEGIHLLTLEPWGDKLLLRLENYLPKSDTSTKEVDLTSILQNIKVKGVKETILSGNEWVNARQKWIWKTDNDFSESFNKEYGNINKIDNAKDIEPVSDDGLKIKIAAKQIRTFIVDYEYYP